MTDAERHARRMRVVWLMLLLFVVGLITEGSKPVPHPPTPTTCEQRWQARRDVELAYWVGRSETDVHDHYVWQCKEATGLER